MRRMSGKSSLALILVALFAALPSAVNAACASPQSARLCVAVDDHAEVWINGTYIGGFDYVNWDQTGVYPKCVTITPASIIQETGNVVAVDVSNLRCCEIWASWAIDTTCADGTNHSYISSNDPGNKIYRIPNACVTTPVPPNDSNGTTWWAVSYTAASTWGAPVTDTGMIWGKQIYDPRTGQLLNTVSYNSGGNAATGDCQHMFMRQPFDMVTQTPPPVANFTITKSVVGATTGINTNQKVTYVLNICNTGAAEPGFVTVNDKFDPGFGFSGYEGGNGGCGNNYNFGPNYCPNSGYFSIQYPKGFPGFTCVNVTVYVQDYWVDSNDYCQVRSNVAGVNWPAETAGDISSNTVNVTMYCPGTPTYTRTVTPTFTISNTITYSPTFTSTPTVTPTPTKTRVPTWTNSPTPVPTNSTITKTYTNTPTFTYTVTVTFTCTATPTVTNTYYINITLSKSEDKTQVPLGDTVQYCLSFTNSGPNVASFDLWDTIPDPMDFLYCTDSCTVNTFTGGCPNSPGGNCRVVTWHISGMQPGDVGTECFWVQAARLQTYAPEQKEFFADVREKFMALLNGLCQTPDRYYRSIRGPDKPG